MYKSPFLDGVVVKLVITPACHAGGRGFKSRPPRHESSEPLRESVRGGFLLFSVSCPPTFLQRGYPREHISYGSGVPSRGSQGNRCRRRPVTFHADRHQPLQNLWEADPVRGGLVPGGGRRAGGGGGAQRVREDHPVPDPPWGGSRRFRRGDRSRRVPDRVPRAAPPVRPPDGARGSGLRAPPAGGRDGRDVPGQGGPRRTRIFRGRLSRRPRRPVRRLPGPPQPRPHPPFRPRSPPARRTDQLPGRRLHPVAAPLPVRLEGGAPDDHPRPGFHGRGHDPHDGDPPLPGAEDVRRHGEALRADPPGGGDPRADPEKRREEAAGGGGVHLAVPGAGHQGARRAVAHQGAGPPRAAYEACPTCGTSISASRRRPSPGSG